MDYKILLFDLDDTLLDFSANEADSLPKLFKRHGVVFSDKTFGIYNAVNKQLWADYEEGAIPLEEVLNTRFSKTMLQFGKTVDGAAWENEYRELLISGNRLVTGALDVCRELAATHRLFAVTNGLSEIQRKRLKQAGLYEYFEDIFTSEGIGYQKPSKGFFDYVADHIRGFKMEEALIIGDSLNTDIRGGNGAGIHTCWFNRHAQKSPADVQSTYTIQFLTELIELCNGKCT